MIDKLESVKKALEYYANDDHWKHIYSSGSALPSDRCKLWQPAQKALAELNEVMDRLNSEELVKCMADAANNDVWQSNGGICTEFMMEAALNIIRGKDND